MGAIGGIIAGGIGFGIVSEEYFNKGWPLFLSTYAGAGIGALVNYTYRNALRPLWIKIGRGVKRLFSGKERDKNNEELRTAVGNSALEKVVQETAVGKSYDELVKWDKVNDAPYGLSGMAIGAAASMLYIPSPWSVGIFGLASGLIVVCTYLGVQLGKLVDWSRRRKAEKEAGIKRLKYDFEAKRGVYDSSLIGIEVRDEHFIIKKERMDFYVACLRQLNNSPSPYADECMRIIDYNGTKKRALVQEIIDEDLRKKILNNYYQSKYPIPEDPREHPAQAERHRVGLIIGF